MSSKIILASGSPRRRMLLEELGVQFEIIKPDIEEVKQDHESAEEYSLRNAKLKAEAVGATSKDAIVISADTIVVFNGLVLEKPIDEADAFRMLTMLSANMHLVITSYCVKYSEKVISKSIMSEVCFRKLEEEEIRNYIKTKEPMDKSGSYGIQGKGASFIHSISGSYTNIVGLPMSELVEDLEHLGFNYYKQG